MAALVTLGLRTLAFIALVALICVPLELLWPRVAGRLAPRSWLCDVGYLAVGALFLSQLLEPILAALTRALPSPPPSTSAVRWLASFFGAELLGYVAHRLLHQVPWLWRFHAVHHAPRHIDFWKAWRQHPLDLGLHTLFGGAARSASGLFLVVAGLAGSVAANLHRISARQRRAAQSVAGTRDRAAGLSLLAPCVGCRAQGRQLRRPVPLYRSAVWHLARSR